MEKFVYHNKKSRNDGQVYIYHTNDGRVYLTPEKNGKTKVQVRMPFAVFWKAVKDGYYISTELLKKINTREQTLKLNAFIYESGKHKFIF